MNKAAVIPRLHLDFLQKFFHFFQKMGNLSRMILKTESYPKVVVTPAPKRKTLNKICFLFNLFEIHQTTLLPLVFSFLKVAVSKLLKLM
jgi:hypothetical protein